MLAQLIGFVGFIFLGISNLKKDRKSIIIFQIISSIFFSVHYFLINAITASIINIIGIFRGITFYNKNRSTKLNYMYLSFYILIYIIIGLSTYDSFISILPVVAYTLFTISIFNENPLYIKLINVSVSSLWLVYDIIYKSYAGMVSDTCMIITLIVGMFFIIVKKK